MNDTPSMSRTKRAFFTVMLCLGLPLVALVLVEGSTSLLLFGRDYRNARAPRANSRPHTGYDTLLGWVNRPDFASPDEYGKNIALTTNNLGFRGSKQVSPTDTATPRLVCSGDSFTLGYGVADERAWCHLLESYFPGLQTLNMGQGAYGLDQAFLWYRRDGVPVPHRVTVFSMTYVEMERSVTPSYMGRFKPIVVLEGGKVQASHVPVPAQTDDALRRAYAGRLLNNLRTMQVIRKFSAFDGRSGTARLMEGIWPTFEAVFDELDSLNRTRGSALVLAYLPTPYDVSPGPLDQRRARLAKYAEAHHVRFIDLTPALRALRKDSIDLAFIAKAPPGAAPGVAGHYTNLGNAWAARELALQLRALPALAPLAGKTAPDAAAAFK